MAEDVNLALGFYASVAAALISSLGLISVALAGDWGRRQSPYFSAFAIGVLLTGIGLHLVPESLGAAPSVWRIFAAAFGLMAAIGLILRLGLIGRKEAQRAAYGFASIVPLGFHSFIDGTLYEASFNADLFTGLIATAGLLLHEFPEGVIAYFLMIEAGLKKTAAVVWAIIASSLTTLAGAVFSALFLSSSNGIPMPAVLAGAAGALAYIVIFHLGPHAAMAPNKQGYIWAMAGVLVATIGVTVRHFFGLH